MLKASKRIICHNKWEIRFLTSLFIRKGDAELEDFILQIYDTDKFRKWINFFPFVWVNFDKKHFDVGCTGTFNFLFPLFSYKMVCVEAEHNKYYRAVFTGLMKGESEVGFKQNTDGIFYDHTIKISGVNKLVHLYYWLFLKPLHLPFMTWRYLILKKNLIYEALEKRESKKSEI